MLPIYQTVHSPAPYASVVIFSSAFHIPWLFFFAYSDRRADLKFLSGRCTFRFVGFVVFPALKSGSLLVITVVFCIQTLLQ